MNLKYAIMDFSTRRYKAVTTVLVLLTVAVGFLAAVPSIWPKAFAVFHPITIDTDPGSQFTSIDFTKVLLEAGIQISMDGKGRVFDNIFSERLWQTVKVEKVYLRDYQTVAEAR